LPPISPGPDSEDCDGDDCGIEISLNLEGCCGDGDGFDKEKLMEFLISKVEK